ncbi:GntR family transcriptional regulator [Micromonospora sp. NPDC049679]|uniref:GntR family transcriptional regulator n=1 Tax=Micromonospora sp. NPDC049679 TaxID=3155920 RepID=UPI0033D1AAF1
MIETPRSQYIQICELLRGRIQDGTYPRGSLLPSEDRLAQELGVSRVTINRAIGLLRLAGDVKVRRGTGTSVRSLPRILRDAQVRYAARQEGSGAGEVEASKLNLKSLTEYRRIARTTPPQAVGKTLGLRKSEAALLRSRVLYANDEPTQIADSYLPWSIVKDCEPLMQPDAGTGGSYGRLAELGHGPVRFTEDVTIRMPNESEQRTLELEATQPVFEIWHVAYTVENRPIEVCIHVMPGHLWTLRYGWTDQPPSERAS